MTDNRELREKLGEKKRKLAKETCSPQAYRKKLTEFYRALFD